MKKVIFLLFILMSFNAFPVFTPAKFARDFTGYESAMGPHVFAHKNKYRYVFIGGILSEPQLFYFADNIKFLSEMGVPSRLIHSLFPSSFNSIETNAYDVMYELMQIKKDHRPLIIIGHSSGAVEAFVAAVSDPVWFQENVKALFCIQGVFGGSGVADHLIGLGRPISPNLRPDLKRILQGTWWASKLLPGGMTPGLESMGTIQMNSYMKRILKHARENSSIIEKKIFYITSSLHPDQVSPILKASAWYLHTSYKFPSDGLVEERKQSLSFGVPLLSAVGDHASLTVPEPVSNVPSIVRDSLMYAIMKGL